VNIDAKAGNVHGAGLIAVSKSTPSRASASMRGDVGRP
jgi:hypothetical protein